MGPLLDGRAPRGGARPGRSRLLPVLVRSLRGLLGRLRGGVRARGPRHSRRRAGHRAAPGRDGEPGRDRDLLHAVLRAAPGRGRPRARDRARAPRGADGGARGGARRGHPRGAGAHRGGLGRAGLRPRGHDRDGRLRLRVRGAGRAARQRGRVHRRDHRSGHRAIRGGGGAGVDESGSHGLAAAPLPHRRRGAGGPHAVRVRPHLPAPRRRHPGARRRPADRPGVSTCSPPRSRASCTASPRSTSS